MPRLQRSLWYRQKEAIGEVKFHCRFMRWMPRGGPEEEHPGAVGGGHTQAHSRAGFGCVLKENPEKSEIRFLG